MRAAGQRPQSLFWLSLAWWAGAWGAVLAVALLWWGTLAPPLREQLQDVMRGGGLMAVALVLFTLPLFVWAVQYGRQRRSQWRSQTLSEALRQSQAKAADLERYVAEATRSLARDRHVLAALVAELTQGVLVCHGSGEIMLYNRAARQLLQPPTEGPSGQRWLGIGRSVHALLDPALLAHPVGRAGKGQFGLINQRISGPPLHLHRCVVCLPTPSPWPGHQRLASLLLHRCPSLLRPQQRRHAQCQVGGRVNRQRHARHLLQPWLHGCYPFGCCY